MQTSYIKMKFGAQQRKRSGIYLRCETCAREFYVSPSRVRQVERQGAKIRFCSMTCYDKTGENNPSFGKKHTPAAIAKMRANPNRPRFSSGPDNPNFVRFGADYKHQESRRLRVRLLTERGPKCERCGYDTVAGVLEIHHKDRNRKNNSCENLELLCPTCHAVEHFLNKDGNYNRLKEAA